jgi:protein-S-isoprenylcysteine O-methyltransferase Ste14
MSETSPSPQQQPRPFNQKIRYWAMRLAVLACLPLILFSHSAWEDYEFVHPILETLGALLIISAVLYRFWAILYIGGRKNQQIIQDGPYSMCRHPLYFGTTLGAIGLGLMLGSFLLAVLLGVLALGILSATAAREERFLRSEFGADYDAYAARVPRIVPRPSLFHTEPEVTFNTHTLRNNLADAMGFLAVIPLAELMETLHEAGIVGTIVLP